MLGMFEICYVHFVKLLNERCKQILPPLQRFVVFVVLTHFNEFRAHAEKELFTKGKK